MFNWKEFDKARDIFSQVGPGAYREDWGQHHVEVRPKDLLRWIELCKEDLGYLTLVDIVGVDRNDKRVDPAYRFELVYHLLNMGSHQRLNLHVHFNDLELIPSVRAFYPHADWMETEQRELLNINFDRPAMSLLLPKNQQIYPMRKDAEIKNWPTDPTETLPKIEINPNKSETPYAQESYIWKRFDILSKETSGSFEWWVCFDPERVVQSEVKIGFHHQGFEKLLETKDWLQVMQLVDKIQVGAAPTYSIAWAKTLEESLRIKIPERAQAIRIVMLELARIAEHFTVMFEMTKACGQEEFKLFLNAREKIYELFEKYCGQRQGLGIVRLGGLRQDLPHGWIVEYQTAADILTKSLRTIHNSLISQRNFRTHLDGASVNAQTVLFWGVSGPSMRASGLNFDLRKSQPFYFYQDIDFDVPVGIHGTAYDRYLIRYEEVFQSLRIITQVIDNLPLGEVETQVPEYEVPERWHYSGLESPNGEAGFLLLTDEKLHPYRVKIKTPSLPLAQALPQFIKGLRQEQLPAFLASLGLRRLEMDR